ncbi:MAG: SspB family protein [Rhizobiaceae bacterium]
MAEETEVEDLIRYDVLAQEALRGVVRKVLQEVARTGLPGEHHFYVTFDTNFTGVRMSTRMKEKYPEEMTIVVQHQFWDLEATETGFSIGLSFDNVPENLLVPFDAITGFFDPSVQFGLQFDTDIKGAHEDDKETTIESIEQTKVDALPAPEKGEAKSDDDRGDEDAGSAEVVSLDAFRKK